MFDVGKVTKVDICTEGGNILQSLTSGFSFPKFQDNEQSAVKLIIIKGSNLPLYPRGSPVVTVIYLKSGDRLSFSSVVTVSTEIQLNIGIYLDKTATLEERRRYFKIECDLICGVVGYARGEKKFDFNPYLNGKIHNINIGGIFLTIEAEEDFLVDDVISVVIPDLKMDSAGYLLNILRTQRAQDGTFLGYGCKFLYLDPKREEFLGQFIHMLQIEKRKQEKFK